MSVDVTSSLGFEGIQELKVLQKPEAVDYSGLAIGAADGNIIVGL